MDILEELPTEQWPLLQDKLKLLWPLNLPGYYTLHVNSMCPGVKEAFKFKVYCPYGDLDNGLVAINIKTYQDVTVFSITEDTSKIEEALVKTKLIDWSKIVHFDAVTSLTLQALKRLQDVMHFERFYVARAQMYHLAGTTKPFDKFKLPDKTVMTSVKPEHLQQVENTWAYTNVYTNFYFKTLISNGLSYGLYSSDTGELLAWVFINEYNYLCHLYCEEKHRRRGYAQYVMQCVVNDLLKDGHDVYGYVVDGNEKPLAIFAKFGFKPVDEAAFVMVEKNVNKV